MKQTGGRKFTKQNHTLAAQLRDLYGSRLMFFLIQGVGTAISMSIYAFQKHWCHSLNIHTISITNFCSTQQELTAYGLGQRDQ